MSLYQIIGLKKEDTIGYTYKTDSKDYILHDENKKGITENKIFTNYIIYILLEDTYYSIHLSEFDNATYSGRLCHYGKMKIINSDYIDIETNSTHIPIKPLFISGNFELKEYEYDEYMHIYLYEESDTLVFQFNGIGGDERTPNGYINVNMNLFEVL